MTEQSMPHAADGMIGEHGKPDDHGEDHGHDDHAHGGEELGPIDVTRWGALVLGAALGLVTLVAFLQALA